MESPTERDFLDNKNHNIWGLKDMDIRDNKDHIFQPEPGSTTNLLSTHDNLASIDCQNCNNCSKLQKELVR